MQSYCQRNLNLQLTTCIVEQTRIDLPCFEVLNAFGAISRVDDNDGYE